MKLTMLILWMSIDVLQLIYVKSFYLSSLIYLQTCVIERQDDLGNLGKSREMHQSLRLFDHRATEN
jgi:hypothetical protein